MSKLESKAILIAWILFTAGFSLRVVWSFYGLEWSYWLSNIAASLFFILPGIATLLTTIPIPLLDNMWLRNKKLDSRSNLTPIRKIAYLILAFLELLIGTLILLLTIRRMIIGCSPMEDCGGLF